MILSDLTCCLQYLFKNVSKRDYYYFLQSKIIAFLKLENILNKKIIGPIKKVTSVTYRYHLTNCNVFDRPTQACHAHTIKHIVTVHTAGRNEEHADED